MCMSFETFQTNETLGERGKIDIHRPADAPRRGDPFVLAVHGGGWVRGDRTSFHWVADRLLPHGFTVITCSYRTSGEARFPAAYDDLVALLVWLRVHAGELGLGRCALLGSSAGGHLVSLLATRATRERRGQIIELEGVVAYCGPMDMLAMHEWNQGNGSPITRDFMGDPQQRPDAFRDASPIHHVHRDMPAMWLAHGDADQVVPIAQTQRFAQRLADAGVEHTFHTAVGRPHTMVHDDHGPFVLLEEQRVLEFLRQCLRVDAGD
jgi:acetyl esterase/lipase